MALFAATMLVGIAVALGWLTGFDRAVLTALAVDPRGDGALAMSAITWIGDFWPRMAIAAVIAAAMAARRRQIEAAALIALLVSASTFVSLVKIFVARPRPDLVPHLDVVTSASFPSGHAANNMVLWLALAMLLRHRAALLLLAVPVTIGVSRVALGVHWPSDVLAGWALGAGWTLLLLGLVRPAMRDREA